jgi:hypothetical protein
MTNPLLVALAGGVIVGAILSWAATTAYYRMQLKRELRDKYVQLSLAHSETETLQRRLELLSHSTESFVFSSGETSVSETVLTSRPALHPVESATSHRS